MLEEDQTTDQRAPRGGVACDSAGGDGRVKRMTRDGHVRVERTDGLTSRRKAATAEHLALRTNAEVLLTDVIGLSVEGAR